MKLDKKIKILKNRSDIGAGTRGSDMGIDALEIAAINSGNNFFNQHPHNDIPTHNESIYQKKTNSIAKRISFVSKQCERVALDTEKALKDGFFPLILSGDHSSALGSLSGIKNYLGKDSRLGAIWLDAHADIHSPYTTPSGNVHGMPLAAALGIDNLEHKTNDIDEQTLANWEKMKKMSVDFPTIKPEDLVYIALRDTEKAEDAAVENLKIKNHSVSELRYLGLKNCIGKIIESLSHCTHIYISFDVDCMDCDYVSKGTGTPVSKGLFPDEISEILELLFQTEKVIALEVCEINPLLDMKGNYMAETAFDIVNKLLE